MLLSDVTVADDFTGIRLKIVIACNSGHSNVDRIQGATQWLSSNQ